MGKHLVTAALPYANGPLHIGHIAGAYLPADIYVRFLRNTGEDVAFICGSDEHGVPIMLKAKKEGISIKELIDKYNGIMKDAFDGVGISFDHYGRTSNELHYQTSSDFFSKLYRDGIFEEMVTEQLYDEKENFFLADRFVVGVCPKCSADGSYGDQCEKCGTSHNAVDLIDPISIISGNSPVLKKTKHWFLPLNKYSDWLKEWALEENKDIWKNNVYGQVKGWIEDGLKPRAVTRDLDWGIPVPLKEAKGKVLYVWFDAPIGYISSTKEWANKTGKNWKDYWQNKDCELIHFVGKDNIVFHAIIFPVMLKAHGDYILPKNIPANEFLNLEGKKLSTSKNWAVWVHEYLEDFPDNQDSLRYILATNAPENKDNDFTWKEFQAKNNNELVAIFGNFINRVFSLIQKYYNGEVPKADNLENIDNVVLEKIYQVPHNISELLKKFKFKDSIFEMMSIARIGNKYLADEEPWIKIKNDESRVRSIMFVSIQIAAYLAYSCEPFLPNTFKKLSKIINLNDDAISWQDKIMKRDIIIPPGHKTNEPFIIFRKIDDSEIDSQIRKLEERYG